MSRSCSCGAGASHCRRPEPQHTDLKQPKMWPIFEIRHIQNRSFYSLSAYRRTKASQDISSFVYRLLVFCVHECKAPCFFSVLPCRICLFKLRLSSRCSKSTTVCLFLFTDVLWNDPMRCLLWHVICDMFFALFLSWGQKCDDSTVCFTFSI